MVIVAGSSGVAVMVIVAVNVLTCAVTMYTPVFVPSINPRLAVPFMVWVVVANNPCDCQLTVVVAT